MESPAKIPDSDPPARPDDLLAALASGPIELGLLRPTPPAFDAAREELVAILLGRSHLATPEERAMEPLRELCRQGNPFPLLAFQWPNFLITEPSEARYFEGTIGSREDPCLRLDFWQRDILRSIFDEGIVEVAIKGNTKAGKGTSTSLAVNLWFDVYPETKIILTSATFDHAVSNIFGEIIKWRDRMRHPGAGRVRADSIADTSQHWIAVKNPQTGEGFSGQHGPRTLFIFDEASSVPEMLYENAQKQFRKIVALSNPRTLSGWFRGMYKPCADPDVTQTVQGPFGPRRCVTVSGLDCSNVRHKRLEKPLSPAGGITIAGVVYPAGERIPDDHWEQVKPLVPEQCDFGRYMGICQHPDARHVAIYAHGKFPQEDPMRQVILGSWLPRHVKAWSPAVPVTCFGADIARSLDGDATILAAGGEQGCAALHAWRYADITFHVAEIVRLAREAHQVDLTLCRNPVCVDMDGLGAGVGDGLRAMGVWVIEFRGNATSQVDPRVYANLRAEAYGTLGRRLSPDDYFRDATWALPDDAELHRELCAPEKIYSGDGLRWRVQPKSRQPGMPENIQTIKEKLEGHSPDKADAVAYLFHAVREYHALNSYFQAAAGPLVVYPERSPREGEPPVESDLLTYLEREYGGSAQRSNPYGDW